MTRGSLLITRASPLERSNFRGGKGRPRGPAVDLLRPKRFGIFSRSAEKRMSRTALNLLKRQESEVPGRRVFPVKRSRDTRRYGIYCRIPSRVRTRTRSFGVQPLTLKTAEDSTRLFHKPTTARMSGR